MTIRTKTGHWTSLSAIRNHYGYSADDAIREGRAVVGPPPVPEGSTLRISYVDCPGQYVIITPEVEVGGTGGSEEA